MKIQQEKERQLEEWAELNSQRRKVAIELQKEKEELEKNQVRAVGLKPQEVCVKLFSGQGLSA